MTSKIFYDFQNRMEDFKEEKLDEEITHDEFTKVLPEHLDNINTLFTSVFGILDALTVSKDDKDLKHSLRVKLKKLQRRVTKIMDLHREEEETEDASRMAVDDQESIEEISSGGGGAVQGSPGMNSVDSSGKRKYGKQKINVRRFK